MNIIFLCDECPHIFSLYDVQEELSDEDWGHPCFMDKQTKRCESYRACYRQITSPITDDSFVEEEKP
jgi:hypothetical protein